jgi:hypothetical protein
MNVMVLLGEAPEKAGYYRACLAEARRAGVFCQKCLFIFSAIFLSEVMLSLMCKGAERTSTGPIPKGRLCPLETKGALYETGKQMRKDGI